MSIVDSFFGIASMVIAMIGIFCILFNYYVNIKINNSKKEDKGEDEGKDEIITECCACPLPDPIIYPLGTTVDILIHGKFFAVGKIIGYQEGLQYNDLSYRVKYVGFKDYIHYSNLRIHKTKKQIAQEKIEKEEVINNLVI